MPAPRGKLDVAAFPREEILAATGLDVARLARRLRPTFETRFARRSAAGARSTARRAPRSASIAATSRPASGASRSARSSSSSRPATPPRCCATPAEIAKPLGLALEFESKAERGYRLVAGDRIPAAAQMAPPAPRRARHAERGVQRDFRRRADPGRRKRARRGARRRSGIPAPDARRAAAPALGAARVPRSRAEEGGQADRRAPARPDAAARRGARLGCVLRRPGAPERRSAQAPLCAAPRARAAKRACARRPRAHGRGVARAAGFPAARVALGQRRPGRAGGEAEGSLAAFAAAALDRLHRKALREAR